MEKNLVNDYWDQFLNLITNCEDKQELERLFQFILTYDEREMVAKRLALTEALLKKEKSQRQIAKDLEMSIAFITRGSNELKRTSDDNITQMKYWLNIEE